MTAPTPEEEPTSEQAPAATPPPSPEVAEVEEALDTAEQSMVPILTAAILAALAASAVAGDDNDHPGMNMGVIAKGALVPAYKVLESAAYGLTETVRGMLMMILHPIIFKLLVSNDPTGRISADELRRTATDAADRAINLASSSLDSYTTTNRSSYTTTDIYRMFTSTSTTETRTTQQRRVEYFSVKLARWVTREAVFGAQERVADRLGFTHKRWISERDNRVRNEHRYLDGQAIPLGDTFVTPTGNIRYPGDITAPAHLVLNCFPGDTSVQSFSDVEAVYRRWYEGPAVQVDLASGIQLTVTPNHPIFANGDWQPAQLLRVGDELIRTVPIERSSAEPDVQDLPPTMREVFDSLAFSANPERVTGGGMNFHGDGVDGEVDIVRPLGGLTVPGLRQHLVDQTFRIGDDRLIQIPADSDTITVTDLTGRRIVTPPERNVRTPRDRLTLRERHLRETDFVGLARGTQLDAPVSQPPRDSSPGRAHIIGERLEGFPFRVASDKIIDIKIVTLNDHVYNLQTRNGWYSANSTVSHNCRCTLEWIRRP